MIIQLKPPDLRGLSFNLELVDVTLAAALTRKKSASNVSAPSSTTKTPFPEAPTDAE
jgi:hypothetical protein